MSVEEQSAAWIDRLSLGTRLYPEHLEGTGAAVLRFSNGAVTGISGGRKHRSTNVGFGLSYALPIVVACLTARRGDLLMVENPEAHLHPRAQADLGLLCALASSAGVQVLVETHSDHVLNAIRIAVADGILASSEVSLHFFRRPDSSGPPSVDTLRVESNGEIGSWPDGFFDEYMNALLTLSEFQSRE